MQGGRNMFHLIPLFHLIPQICFQTREEHLGTACFGGVETLSGGISPSLIPIQPWTKANPTEMSPSRSSWEHPSTL